MNIKFSKKLILLILLRYKKYTFTEALTAVFSQLDGFIVVQLLNPEQAYVYLLIRKVIRAVNALVTQVYRISFTRSKKGDRSSLAILIQLFIFNISFVVSINILSYFFYEEINFLLGSRINSKDVFNTVLQLQSLILIVGYFKVVIRNNYLLSNELFSLHLIGTIFSLVVFILPLAYNHYISILVSAIEMSFYRVLADLAYVLFASFFYYKSALLLKKCR